MYTIFHADDCGISKEQVNRILACSTLCGGVGALNSTSIFANSLQLKECAELIHPYKEQGVLLAGVHLNLTEGSSCADPRSVPLLVDEKGMLKCSFSQLFFASLGRQRKAFRAQISLEVKAQIQRFLEEFPSCRQELRIDGHQHIHMLPLVLDALVEEAGRDTYKIAYLRVPSESLRPYRFTRLVRKGVPPLNWVKVAVLRLLAFFGRKKLSKIDAESAVFCGVLFSGVMDRFDDELLENLQRYAKRHQRNLEILFHPGGVDSSSACLDPGKSEFTSFYTSSHRTSEALRLSSLRHEEAE